MVKDELGANDTIDCGIVDKRMDANYFKFKFKYLSVLCLVALLPLSPFAE